VFPIIVFGPEVADGCALEDQEEEVHCAEKQDDCEGNIYDASLVSFAGETQEIGSNGEFGDGSCDDIEKFGDEHKL
jgi:hypothetical protein